MIQQEAEGRAQAARIRAVAEAEAEAIRMKAQALVEAGEAYMDLRRLELAPALTREVAAALSNGQFVNFGTSGGDGDTAPWRRAPTTCCASCRRCWPRRSSRATTARTSAALIARERPAGWPAGGRGSARTARCSAGHPQAQKLGGALVTQKKKLPIAPRAHLTGTFVLQGMPVAPQRATC